MQKTHDFLKKILPSDTVTQTLDKIIEYLKKGDKHCHVVSINPEIVLEAQKDQEFKRILVAAQIKIVDGVGVWWAGKVFGLSTGQRFTGVDLMKFLLKEASNRRLRVLLLGGGPKVAEKIVDRQRKAGSMASFNYLEGYKDKNFPTTEEDEIICSTLASFKPQILLVSFGSPHQEKWIDSHKKQLGITLCAGVGGAFDFLAGSVPRAPHFVRRAGLEWLFRLLIQPWRIRRQAKLINFVSSVLKEKAFGPR